MKLKKTGEAILVVVISLFKMLGAALFIVAFALFAKVLYELDRHEQAKANHV